MRIETGIDIVSIDRIKDKFNNDSHFMHLIFTDNEIEELNSKSRRFQTIAGRWCAKEAFSKALGTGFGRHLNWKDVEILSDEDGKPRIHLSREQREELRIKSISLSISHTKDNAIAVITIILRK
ncbi:MAG: holo-ACP synthase [candidate division WOR-3 bacterium]|nr:holo-ACP synthase [candidate division WOR-3 bacterium]